LLSQHHRRFFSVVSTLLALLGTMHLMYTMGPVRAAYLPQDGKRIYTLKKATASGEMTRSAHPARFSPDDKFSRHRITIKKRFGLLPTQTRA